jgi:dTDP-3-amino-2,3,6-trideoxy-4-keto-D-glucose/dTDP-3-amino-3,4,6-trideoxy-alpha-D-glucose/dTDP-2,6-dideoxy-D-kanosamine transaminase
MCRMAVPFNDTRRRFAANRKELMSIWQDFLDNGVFVGGPPIVRFEHQFAEYCNAQYCVALASGTDALELALRAVGVRRGDEVITVANAGGYTTTACFSIGAIPVYIDIDPATAQLNVNELGRSLSSKTKALVVTHLYGLMNDVSMVRSRLNSLGREDVLIIEDCAQAHGAVFDGHAAGSLGDAGAFSFYPTKNLGAVGDAGAIVCSDIEVAQRAAKLRQYGWDRKYHSVLEGGRNSRMDPLQAMMLSEQLSTLADSNTRRRNICKLYAGNLKPGWKMICSKGEKFVGHLAVLVAPNSVARDDARRLLTECGIGCDVHYPTLDCDQTAWQGQVRISGDLRMSRLLTQQILSIPCFPEMTADEVEQVVDAIRTF